MSGTGVGSFSVAPAQTMVKLLKKEKYKGLKSRNQMKKKKKEKKKQLSELKHNGQGTK